MRDGLVAQAEVYRPLDGSPRPAILSHGPHRKGLAFHSRMLLLKETRLGSLSGRMSADVDKSSQKLTNLQGF
jgi:predicted acyl esterase